MISENILNPKYISGENKCEANFSEKSVITLLDAVFVDNPCGVNSERRKKIGMTTSFWRGGRFEDNTRRVKSEEKETTFEKLAMSVVNKSIGIRK